MNVFIFEDVCTINELLSIAQRFAVAKMLKENNTYLEVAEKPVPPQLP